MSFVSLKNVNKQYKGNDKKSVTDFNLNIEKGEFIAFVGPSGCGKSTTLRMIAGFEDVTEGSIEIDGQVVNNLLPRDRGIAMVFQNYALYPHMTVEKNIAFGLKNIKTPKEEIDKKVDWAVDILGLEEYRKRKPKNLSGGQRQRVALGRAIVRNQKVFLMDEPLSNLDAKLRVSMRNEITKLHRELGATTIYVTHDQIEAMTMADRIVVMKDGVIQQIGSPIKLYDEPVNKFVAGFIGSPQMNFIEVNIIDNIVEFKDGNKIHLSKGVRDRLQKSGKMILGIRGEDIKFDFLNMNLRKDDILHSTVTNVEVMGNENNIYFSLGDETVVARASKYDLKNIGEKIEFVIDTNRLHFFDIETGENIITYLHEGEPNNEQAKVTSN
ncbi:MAG: sn-glycerol-3-phosphate ABC transporter ATP-binding protein UgpC [Clostridium sp.]|nr:sn-glycerol-3-phosphate ABC transporter ATP-binding protein UgpC [Clostridium sp.]